MIKRIDALRLDPARVHSAGNEAQNVEMPGADRIRSQQVDSIQFRTDRVQGAGTPEQSATEGLQEQPSRHRTHSPDEILAAFVAPDVPDQAIFRRSVSILQHCITDVVPNLDREELREGVKNLLEEEIERHQALFERMQGGFEPE